MHDLATAFRHTPIGVSIACQKKRKRESFFFWAVLDFLLWLRPRNMLCRGVDYKKKKTSESEKIGCGKIKPWSLPWLSEDLGWRSGTLLASSTSFFFLPPRSECSGGFCSGLAVSEEDEKRGGAGEAHRRPNALVVEHPPTETQRWCSHSFRITVEKLIQELPCCRFPTVVCPNCTSDGSHLPSSQRQSLEVEEGEGKTIRRYWDASAQEKNTVREAGRVQTGATIDHMFGSELLTRTFGGSRMGRFIMNMWKRLSKRRGARQDTAQALCTGH